MQFIGFEVLDPTVILFASVDWLQNDTFLALIKRATCKTLISKTLGHKWTTTLLSLLLAAVHPNKTYARKLINLLNIHLKLLPLATPPFVLLCE